MSSDPGVLLLKNRLPDCFPGFPGSERFTGKPGDALLRKGTLLAKGPMVLRGWCGEADKKQAWTGRSTLQPAGRPALQFHALRVGEAGGATWLQPSIRLVRPERRPCRWPPR